MSGNLEAFARPVTSGPVDTAIVAVDMQYACAPRAPDEAARRVVTEAA